jgi:hypothetical protein
MEYHPDFVKLVIDKITSGLYYKLAWGIVGAGYAAVGALALIGG